MKLSAGVAILMVVAAFMVASTSWYISLMSSGDGSGVSTSTPVYTIHTQANQAHDKLIVSLSGSDGSLTADSVIVPGGVQPDTSTPPYGGWWATTTTDLSASTARQIYDHGHPNRVDMTARRGISKGSPTFVWQSIMTEAGSYSSASAIFVFDNDNLPSHSTEGQSDFHFAGDYAPWPAITFDYQGTVAAEGRTLAVYLSEFFFAPIALAFEWPLEASAFTQIQDLELNVVGQVLTLSDSTGAISSVTLPAGGAGGFPSWAATAVRVPGDSTAPDTACSAATYPAPSSFDDDTASLEIAAIDTQAGNSRGYYVCYWQTNNVVLQRITSSLVFGGVYPGLLVPLNETLEISGVPGSVYRTSVTTNDILEPFAETYTIDVSAP